jgi:4-diphosphocytidyl-2-C-methyl-D-erythritol kinase
VVAPLALGRPLDFVIAKPPAGLSTADVYRNVTIPERPETGEELRRAVAAGDVDEMGRRLHNRLQEAAQRLRPEIGAGLERLRALGSAGQLMSGSGTSLFALCRNPGEAQRLARALKRPGEVPPSGAVAVEDDQVYVVRSCS